MIRAFKMFFKIIGYVFIYTFAFVIARILLPFYGIYALCAVSYTHLGNGVEIYKSSLYFIVTGEKLIYETMIENQEAIDYVVGKYFRVIPRGMLYEDVALNCQVVKDTAAISYEYQLRDEPVALQAGCTLMSGVRQRPVEDTSKYYVARKWGKRKGSAGGTYENGWMKTSIRAVSYTHLRKSSRKELFAY